MTTSNRLDAVDRNGLPEVSALTDDRLRVLWVLAISRRDPDLRYLTPTQVSDALRDIWGVNVSRQMATAILGKERRAVAKLRRNGRTAYQIMQHGLDEISATPASVVYIEPSQALSGIRQVQTLLLSVKGAVSVCDPYVDPRTLDLVADMRSAHSVRLLTQNVDKGQAVKRDIAALAAQHGIALEVRVLASKVLHDRYAIYDDGMLLFGTSLNGLGKKQSFVVAVGEDVRFATLATFETLWMSASPF